MAVAAAAHSRRHRHRAGDGAARTRGALGPQSAASTTVVVLVDRSASMGAAAPTGTESGRRDPARRSAPRRRGRARHAGRSGRAAAGAVRPIPEPTTQRPSADIGRLRTAAQNLSVSARTTDHRRALEFAADALARSHALNRELFWITDLQSVGWTSTGPFAAATARIPEGPWAQSRVYRRAAGAAEPGERVRWPTRRSRRREAEVALSVTSRSFGAPRRSGRRGPQISGPEALGRGFLNVPERGGRRRCSRSRTFPSRAASSRSPTTRCRSTTAGCSHPADPARCAS